MRKLPRKVATVLFGLLYKYFQEVEICVAIYERGFTCKNIIDFWKDLGLFISSQDIGQTLRDCLLSAKPR